MANRIVQVTVSQQVAAAPSQLQRTGAIITQGGTNTAPGTRTLLTQLSDLTAILATSKTISTLTWASTGGGTATLTTASPHGWGVGDVIPVTVAGVTPAGYNGTVTATITGTSTMTYPLVSNPGAMTVAGTVILGAVAELLAAGTTFFAQGSGQSVYVLDLGEGIPSAGVAALGTYITANPGFFYSYLVPKSWDAVAEFLAFLAGFEATTSKTYFFVTTTTGTYTSYTALMKCVLALIQAPAAPTTEFTLAAVFWVTLGYNPSSTQKVTPLAFSYLVGVAAYPETGNSALLATLKAANINVVGTGAEGGISNTILFWGHVKDGNPFNYWYSVDWAQINIELAVANEIINGSNNPLAPLLYDQNGINRLQAVGAQVLSNGVTYGLATGTVVQTQLSTDAFVAAFEAEEYRGELVINAEPFLVYTDENPSDYAIGKYGGFAATWTPGRPFEQIIFALNVVNII